MAVIGRQQLPVLFPDYKSNMSRDLGLTSSRPELRNQEPAIINLEAEDVEMIEQQQQPTLTNQNPQYQEG